EMTPRDTAAAHDITSISYHRHATGPCQAATYRSSTLLTSGVFMPPTIANGKICYIEMPTTDVQRSADFYEKIFGWRIRKRGDGSVAFDDGVGEVSGTWVRGRTPSEPGLLIYVMVDSVAAA